MYSIRQLTGPQHYTNGLAHAREPVRIAGQVPRDQLHEMRRKILVSYSMTSTFVQTTRDYLASMKSYLDGDVEYIHVTHDAIILDGLNKYDVIIQNYCARLCFDNYVSKSYTEKLKSFSGQKILAVQDEYDNTERLRKSIEEIGFDLVLTCVPEDSREYVYPKARFPRTEFMTVFTGYVSDELAQRQGSILPVRDRTIVIGYRGRDIGGRYGRLGFEKYEVGRRMREECQKRNIPCDIAMDENSRIYGEKWFEFVGNCRAMLGSESGSNVFDFDGSIKARYDALTAQKGIPPSYAEFLPLVAQRDTEIEMGQISPRVFECAVMKTPMFLIRGRYSDAILPEEHYVPIERDFSNAGEVLDRLGDLDGLQAMADRAYEHIVASGKFSYRAFFGRINQWIAKKEVVRFGLGSVASPGSKVLSFRDRMLVESPKANFEGLDEFRRKHALVNAEQNFQITQRVGKLTLAAAQRKLVPLNMLHRLVKKGEAVYAELQEHDKDALKKLKNGLAEVNKIQQRVKSLTEEHRERQTNFDSERNNGSNEFKEIVTTYSQYLECWAKSAKDILLESSTLASRLSLQAIEVSNSAALKISVRERLEMQYVKFTSMYEVSFFGVARALFNRYPVMKSVARRAVLILARNSNN